MLNFFKRKGEVKQRKNVLVVGGAGFIGSHLCEALVKENNVICVDNFITSSPENLSFLLQNPNFAFLKYDLSQSIDLAAAPELKKFQLDIFGIQEIYNLACPTSAKNFDNLRIETVAANSILVKNVLDLALKYQAQVVHASSAVVYGPRLNNGYVAESYEGSVNFTGPRSCYDEGKRFAEAMIATYNAVYDKSFKIARIFRTYGPRLMLKDGQMISDFMIDALDNKDLVIYGDESWSTALCYIDDIVDGLLKLMASDFAGAVNLGSNVDTPLIDVAQAIIAMTGSKSNIVHQKSLAFITQLALPDITLAKSHLGWYPLVGLTTGLKKTLDYTMANKALLTVGRIS